MRYSCRVMVWCSHFHVWCKILVRYRIPRQSLLNFFGITSTIRFEWINDMGPGQMIAASRWVQPNALSFCSPNTPVRSTQRKRFDTLTAISLELSQTAIIFRSLIITYLFLGGRNEPGRLARYSRLFTGRSLPLDWIVGARETTPVRLGDQERKPKIETMENRIIHTMSDRNGHKQRPLDGR